MSLNASLVLAASNVKDSVMTLADAGAVQDAAQAVSQSVVSAAAEAAKAAGFSAQPTFGEVIEFQLTGLLVVFTVLGGLTIMCYLLAWLLKTIAPNQYYGKSKPAPASSPAPVAPAKSAPAPVAAVPAAAPAVATMHPGLADDELIAILAVAASECLGQAAAIVKFRSQDSMDWTWSVQGRVGLHSSHKL